MKAIVRIVTRSFEPKELEDEPGVFEYEYTISGKTLATLSNFSLSDENHSTINFNSKLNVTFSILMPNNRANRLSRISHIYYLGEFYKVESVNPSGSRIRITPGDVELSELKDKLLEVLNANP